MLQLTNVKKSYDNKPVLDIPSLDLEKGIYWIKGINGSGKTTLLKIIAGLLSFEGNVSFNGIRIKQQPLVYRQQVSWAEAEPFFPSFMKGTELIGLYRRIRNTTQAEADKLVELFLMKDYIDSPTGNYSAGMTKKLSLVLALLGKPSLVILDEPLITLDTEAVGIACHYISEQHTTQDTTFLMSSHQEPDRLLFPGKELTVINHTVLMS